MHITGWHAIHWNKNFEEGNLGNLGKSQGNLLCTPLKLLSCNSGSVVTRYHKDRKDPAIKAIDLHSIFWNVLQIYLDVLSSTVFLPGSLREFHYLYLFLCIITKPTNQKKAFRVVKHDAKVHGNLSKLPNAAGGWSTCWWSASRTDALATDLDGASPHSFKGWTWGIWNH